MNIQNQVEAKLQQLNPLHLEVINESSMHNVAEGSESHFKLIVVSEDFIEKSLVQRHRMVYKALGDLQNQIHALAMHTMTPDEWYEKSGKIPKSPLCQG